MNATDELQHLLATFNSKVRADGFAIAYFQVYCPGNANLVLENCREVLSTVLRQDQKYWPSEDEWRKLLPAWFVERCSRERTDLEEEEDLARWRRLSQQDKILAAETEIWSVGDWISWFDPNDERYWFWWDAYIKDANYLFVAVEIFDYIFPSGSLEWLLKASGALAIAEIDAKLYQFPQGD